MDPEVFQELEASRTQLGPSTLWQSWLSSMPPKSALKPHSVPCCAHLLLLRMDTSTDRHEIPAAKPS